LAFCLFVQANQGEKLFFSILKTLSRSFLANDQ